MINRDLANKKLYVDSNVSDIQKAELMITDTNILYIDDIDTEPNEFTCIDLKNSTIEDKCNDM